MRHIWKKAAACLMTLLLGGQLFPASAVDGVESGEITEIFIYGECVPVGCYYVGEELITEGIEVQAKIDLGYPSWTSEVLPVEDCTFAYDFSESGVQTVTVQYQKFQTTFQAAVIDPENMPAVYLGSPFDDVTGIRSLIYKKGDPLTFQGLNQARLVYEDGTTVTVYNLDPDSIQGDTSVLGEQTMSAVLRIGRDGAYPFSFQALVLEEEDYNRYLAVDNAIHHYEHGAQYEAVYGEGGIFGDYYQYYHGDFSALDFDGHVTAENIDVLAFYAAFYTDDSFGKGQAMTIEEVKAGLSQCFVIKSFDITGNPHYDSASQTYTRDGSDGFGGCVSGYHRIYWETDADGNMAVDYIMKRPGYCHHNARIVYDSEGRIASISFLPMKIEIASTPTLVYRQGQPFDLSNGSLVVWYEEGFPFYDVPLTDPDVTVSGYDADKPGQQTVTIAYRGQEISLEVQVLTPEEARADDIETLMKLLYCNVEFLTGRTGMPEEPFDNWEPDTLRFAGTWTEKNQEALFLFAWSRYAFLKPDTDAWDYCTHAEDSATGSTFKVPADVMLDILSQYMVCSNSTLEDLPYYDKSSGCFIFQGLGGWGGACLDLNQYATITQKDNGNWLVQQRKPSPDAGTTPEYAPELYQFNLELTEDYRLVSLEILMEKLTWKTQPVKTTYEKGQPLDLAGGVITAKHGTGKTFDIPLTADMVSGYDPEKSGKQTLTVTYGGVSIPFEVTVTAPEPEEKPPLSIDDEETGIKLEADPDVVPPDTVMQVEEVKDGGNFTIINNALAQTSDKWVAYDISLHANGVEIQPNGKVKVTIPRPQGLNKNKMALYHVAEDGTLTQIPFTLDAKGNVVFETDHFSLYTLVELEENPSVPVPPTNGTMPVLPWLIALPSFCVFCLLAAVARRRKRQ